MNKQEQLILTKLPHEFKQFEEVLCKYSNFDAWQRRRFHQLYINEFYLGYDDDNRYSKYLYGSSAPSHREVTKEELSIVKTRYCIPYKGNEYFEGKITATELIGTIPEDYVVQNTNK